jgi:hypothetical protein
MSLNFIHPAPVWTGVLSTALLGLSFVTADAQSPQGTPPLGDPCSEPGHVYRYVATKNPNTGQPNSLTFVCAYSDPGKGWRMALLEPYK